MESDEKENNEFGDSAEAPESSEAIEPEENTLNHDSAEEGSKENNDTDVVMLNDDEDTEKGDNTTEQDSISQEKSGEENVENEPKSDHDLLEDSNTEKEASSVPETSNVSEDIAEETPDDTSEKEASEGLKISSFASLISEPDKSPEASDSGIQIGEVTSEADTEKQTETSEGEESKDSPIKIANVVSEDTEVSQGSESSKPEGTIKIANVASQKGDNDDDIVMLDDDEDDDDVSGLPKIANVTSSEESQKSTSDSESQSNGLGSVRLNFYRVFFKDLKKPPFLGIGIENLIFCNNDQ